MKHVVHLHLRDFFPVPTAFGLYSQEPAYVSRIRLSQGMECSVVFNQQDQCHCMNANPS
jgi:hypothetical protein